MTPVATAWEQLLSAALVGTERRPAPPAALADAAGLLGGDPPAASDERHLLTAAGIVATYRRCGFPVPHEEHPSLVPAAGADDRPPAPAPAVHILALLLTGQVVVAGGPHALLAHWLERCTATGHRLPDSLLPGLLDTGTRLPDLREPLIAAGGPRLAWLAGHNPTWAWAPPLAAAPDDVWNTGDHASRFRVLRRLHADDPARARALVQQTWSGEKAADRAEIVEILSAPGDEPFLEAALDDRARSVRRAAARTLAGLPSSRLAQRMADRLRPLVERGTRLTVELPNDLDEAARRDGISDEEAPSRTGRRSWWLTQMIAAAPLDFWTQEFGRTPGQLMAMVEQPEVLDGWARAGVGQSDPRWATALLERRPSPHDPGLLAVLSPEQAYAMLPLLLRTRTDASLPALMAAVPAPWPRALAHAVVARLRAAKTTTTVLACLPAVALAHPDDIDEWLAGLPGTEHQRRQINQLLQALSIRRAISEAFTDD